MLRIVDISGDGNQPASPEMSAANKAGIAGVAVKLTGGESYINPDFSSQWDACARGGMLRSLYHYAHEPGHGSGSALDEAAHFYAARPGDGAGCPIWLDWEEDGWTQFDALDFLSRAEELFNRPCGLYTSPWYLGRYDVDDPAFGRHPLWLASWVPGENPPIPDAFPAVPRPWKAIDLWQFTSRAYVDGIGLVDESLFAGDAAAWQQLAGQRAAGGPVITERQDWDGYGIVVAKEVTVQNPETGVYYSRKEEKGRVWPWRIV